MINIAEMQSTLSASRLQGLDARQKMLHESPAMVEFRVQTALDKLPAVVKESTRMSSWGVVMTLSLGDLPVGIAPGSTLLFGEDLRGAGKRIFDTCSELGLNPRLAAGRIHYYIVIERAH